MSKRRPISNGWWIGLGLIAIAVTVSPTEMSQPAAEEIWANVAPSDTKAAP